MNYLSPKRKPFHMGRCNDGFDCNRNEINSGTDWVVSQGGAAKQTPYDGGKGAAGVCEANEFLVQKIR